MPRPLAFGNGIAEHSPPTLLCQLSKSQSIFPPPKSLPLCCSGTASSPSLLCHPFRLAFHRTVVRKALRSQHRIGGSIAAVAIARLRLQQHATKRLQQRRGLATPDAFSATRRRDNCAAKSTSATPTPVICVATHASRHAATHAATHVRQRPRGNAHAVTPMRQRPRGIFHASTSSLRRPRFDVHAFAQQSNACFPSDHSKWASPTIWPCQGPKLTLVN